MSSMMSEPVCRNSGNDVNFSRADGSPPTTADASSSPIARQPLPWRSVIARSRRTKLLDEGGAAGPPSCSRTRRTRRGRPCAGAWARTGRPSRRCGARRRRPTAACAEVLVLRAVVLLDEAVALDGHAAARQRRPPAPPSTRAVEITEVNSCAGTHRRQRELATRRAPRTTSKRRMRKGRRDVHVLGSSVACRRGVGAYADADAHRLGRACPCRGCPSSSRT